MNKLNEDSLQQLAANILHKDCGWESVYAFDSETPQMFNRTSERQAILPNRLRPALRRLNPWITEDIIDNVVSRLESSVFSDDAITTNEKKYLMLKNGISVTIDINGRKEPKIVRIIDFDNPDENTFTAVRELWMQGDVYRRRADILGFVNGLPLVFIELKTYYKDVRFAYDNNYKDYQQTVPQFFHFNQLVMLTNGQHAVVGALGSKWDFFNEWKRMDESDSEGQIEMGFMLRSMCRKDVLLDLVENFILFDHQKKGTFKILARNHQYMGVNRAMINYRKRKELNGKLGVFWHTQGSGKSYTMVFLANKIRRKEQGTPTFLVLTDREELNKQIAETFESTGSLGSVKASNAIASSGGDLEERLKGNPSYIFTLIHKFNNPNAPILHPDHDIIVFSDEAHRSQYGLLARNMQRMLPDLNLFGFTGTPLLDEEESTKTRFGDYVSIYDFGRAVKDHATVPLLYLNRAELLKLDNPNLDKELIDAIDSEDFDDLDSDQRDALKDSIAKQIFMLCSESRLRKLAADFVDHYIGMGYFGKAMVVSVQKLASVRMYLYAKEEWQKRIEQLEKDIKKETDHQTSIEKQKKLQWLKETEMQVVISSSQNEFEYFSKFGIDIQSIRSEQQRRKNPLDVDFKDSDHPFRIVFVCAMWLTGFDVKSLATIYIDKPLKEHTLMQTIARANRVNEGKENGLIIDYIGIVEQLKEALTRFSGGGTGGTGTGGTGTGGTGGGGTGGGTGNGTGGGTSPIDKIEKLLEESKTLINELDASIAEKAKGTVDNFSLEMLAGLTDEEKRLSILFKVAPLLIMPDDYKKRFRMTFARIEDNVRKLFINGIVMPFYKRYLALDSLQKCAFGQITHEVDLTDLIVKIDEIVSRSIVVNEDKQDFEPIDISEIDFDALVKRFKKAPAKEIALDKFRQKIERAIDSLLKENNNDNRQSFAERYQKIIDDYNQRQDRATIEQVFKDLLDLTRDMSQEQRRVVAEGFDNDAQMAVFDLMNSAKLNKDQVDILKNISKDIIDKVAETIKQIGIWRDDQSKQDKVRNVIRNSLYNLPQSFSDDDLKKYQIVIYRYVYSHEDVSFRKSISRKYSIQNGSFSMVAEV